MPQPPKVPLTPLRKKLAAPTYTTRDVQGYAAQRRALWNVVKQYTGHPLLLEWAADFLRQYHVPERDPAALARAIQLYAQQHVKFFRERPERFTNPVRTLQWGFGDCDDKSILIATVLRSFRVPVRLTFMRYIKPMPDGTTRTISHVYPEAKLNGVWTALESVHPWPMGKDPAQESLAKGYTPIIEHIG